MLKLPQSEIPLEQKSSPHFVHWIFTFMVYLGTMTLMGTVIMHRLIEKGKEETGNSYIFVLPKLNRFSSQTTFQEYEQQNRLVKSLQAEPGILKAEIYHKDNETVRKNVKEQTLLPELPLLIKVTLIDNATTDLAALAHVYNLSFQHLSLEEHKIWCSSFFKIIHSFNVIALVIVAAITISAVMTIAFVTHTGLIIHEKIITILRLMGAPDRFIAKQFQFHSFKMAFKGGLIGTLLSAASLLFIKYKWHTSNLKILNQTHYETELWFIIGFTPLFMIVIIMLSARMTVLMSMQEE